MIISPNQSLTLTTELGKGGEAAVYNIAELPDMVAKVYHHPTATRAAKLRAMLVNPPKQPATHIAIAWPTALLYQHNQQYYVESSLNESGSSKDQSFKGFLMPKITGGRPIFQIYNPVLRGQLPYPFSWQALHRTAYNLCAVIQAIHAKGYIIGDLNESNILVNEQALVTLVDCDSFQVTDDEGITHRCAVGKPEYTAPELHGVILRDVDQTINHDLFGLGVLLFQLLMEGYHPFAGVLPSKASVGRVDLYAIREGLFPYNGSSEISPPPAAPPINLLHRWVKQSFIRCFEAGHHIPHKRPTARQWQQILGQVEPQLQVCSTNQHHYYFPHRQHCPWCHLKPTQLQESIIKKPKPRINMELQLKAGIEAIERNDISLAFKLFNQVVEQGGNPVEGYLHRLKLYHRLQQYDKMLADCQNILALQPDHEEANSYLRIAHKNQYQILQRQLKQQLKVKAISSLSRFEITKSTTEKLFIKYKYNTLTSLGVLVVLFMILLFTYIMFVSAFITTFSGWLSIFIALIPLMGAMGYIFFEVWFNSTKISLVTNQYLTIQHNPLRLFDPILLKVTEIKQFTITPKKNTVISVDYRVMAILKSNRSDVVMGGLNFTEAQFLAQQLNQFLKLT